MVHSEPRAPDRVAAAPLLRVERISKSVPGVQALQDVSLQSIPASPGLVGENGAGKSTLMKILSGVYQPDGGEIIFDGNAVTLHNPAAGAGSRHLHHLSGIQPDAEPDRGGERLHRAGTERGGFVSSRPDGPPDPEAPRPARGHLDPSAIVRDLSVAEQQMVEIAKALSYNAQLVIMDEPTSALTDTEVTRSSRSCAG